MYERRTTPDDVALICENGHVLVTSIGEFPGRPLKKRCDQCGRLGITECPQCKYPITGYRSEEYINQNFPQPKTWTKPMYCTECGEPYPWLGEMLEAANELADELTDLNDSQRAELKRLFPDLIADTPRTTVAIVKFRRIADVVKGPIKDELIKSTVRMAVDYAKEKLGQSSF